MAETNKTDWDEKKNGILKAARQVFARYGFFKATMDDIARAMGMKKGSLYYYYKSKDEIFSDVIAHEFNLFMRAAQQKLKDIHGPREKIISLIRFQLDYLRQVVNLHHLTLQAVLEINQLIHKLYRDYIDKSVHLVADIIKDGVRMGHFKSCDAANVARAILTLSEAIKFREFHTTSVATASEVDYSTIENEVVYITELILDGLEKE